MSEETKLHCPCGCEKFYLYENDKKECIDYIDNGGLWHLDKMRTHRYSCMECY